MSYSIIKTDGSALATVSEGTVNNTTTDITLIGKKYPGYGIFLNENFVKLLENFADITAPTKALVGQIWYDKTNSILRVYTGNTARGQSGWLPVSSSATSPTQPTGAITGDMWWDTTNEQLKVYNVNAWVVIGPVNSSTSGPIVETILDNNSGSHVVVKFKISDSVVAILSKDAQFTPQSTITGFTSIYPGLSLSGALADAQFTGSASNAIAVGGLTANQLLRNDQNASTSGKLTAAGGFRVGADMDIIAATGAVNLTNTKLNSDVNLWVTTPTGGVKAIGITGATAAVNIAGALNVVGTPSFTTPIPVTSGGTGAVTATGTGSAVLSVSPTLSGTPRAPTPPVGTSDTQIATTAFVMASSTSSFAAGTRLAFNQTTAPTGWTKDISAILNDSAMRIVTGVAGSGGATAFSTASYTPTIFASFTADSHVLTIAEMPSHTHTQTAHAHSYTYPGASTITGSGSGTSGPATPASSNTAATTAVNQNTGGGGGHSHTVSGSATSSAISLNLKYVDFIIASKD